MSYERWLKDRLIKKQAPDHDQINKQLNRAIKDLRTRVPPHDIKYS